MASVQKKSKKKKKKDDEDMRSCSRNVSVYRQAGGA